MGIPAAADGGPIRLPSPEPELLLPLLPVSKLRLLTSWSPGAEGRDDAETSIPAVYASALLLSDGLLYERTRPLARRALPLPDAVVGLLLGEGFRDSAACVSACSSDPSVSSKRKERTLHAV